VVRERLGAKAASRLGLWEEAAEYRSGRVRSSLRSVLYESMS